MALSVDRLKSPWFALVRAVIPRAAYAAPRFARVVTASTSGGATKLDVVPEDPAFPSMSGVPLFHGLPGVELTLATGTQVIVEFSEADPAKPFVRSWAGGETVVSLKLSAVASLTFDALQAFVGGDQLAEPTYKGITLNVAWVAFFGALTLYVKGIQTIADPLPPMTGTFTPPLLAAITQLLAALQASLSAKARVE